MYSLTRFPFSLPCVICQAQLFIHSPRRTASISSIYHPFYGFFQPQDPNKANVILICLTRPSSHTTTLRAHYRFVAALTRLKTCSTYSPFPYEPSTLSSLLILTFILSTTTTTSDQPHNPTTPQSPAIERHRQITTVKNRCAQGKVREYGTETLRQEREVRFSNRIHGIIKDTNT